MNQNYVKLGSTGNITLQKVWGYDYSDNYLLDVISFNEKKLYMLQAIAMGCI